MQAEAGEHRSAACGQRLARECGAGCDRPCGAKLRRLLGVCRHHPRHRHQVLSRGKHASHGVLRAADRCIRLVDQRRGPQHKVAGAVEAGGLRVSSWLQAFNGEPRAILEADDGHGVRSRLVEAARGGGWSRDRLHAVERDGDAFGWLLEPGIA